MIAVGFDFDHTLGIDNKLERNVALTLLEECCAAAGRAFERDHATQEVDATLIAYRSGLATVDVAWGSLVDRILGIAHDEEEFVDEFRRRCLEAVPAHVEAVPNARALLDELEDASIPYALLTNGWSPLQEAKARAIGFERPVLVSERIGARKPFVEAFRHLEQVFELPPERIWYVGDDPVVDVAGARSAGLRSVWFDWEGRTYPADALAPSHVIHGLDELLPILKGP